MTRIRFVSLVAATLCAAGALFAQQPSAPANSFALLDGDRVVFYGDSITEQKLYTTDIEEYVLTRFPNFNIRFVNSGVGGDKVSGGWAGPIDLRLQRDVYAHKPTMVTVMLGMNDGYYRPFDDGITSTYAQGYRRMIEQIQSNLATTRLTLIKPSPFDDVTRNPQWEPGYNTVMQRFGEFVSQLGQEKHMLVADMNAPVVDALTKAKAQDPVMATTLVQDRVHPGSGIHWVMAASVLKAWNAPATVTSVTIDGAKASVTDSVNTEITLLKKPKKGPLTWSQMDRALPLPLPPAEVDPFIALTLTVSDITQSLNQQPLRVTGLAAGNYELTIDDKSVGKFTAEQLAAGINLAVLETPMVAQSRLVAYDTEKKNGLEWAFFTTQNDARDANAQATSKKLAAALAQAFERQHKDAQPVPHRYTLSFEPQLTASK